MLMDHESAKLRSAEETHQTEMREWRQALKPRKQVSSRTVCSGRIYCTGSGLCDFVLGGIFFLGGGLLIV